MSVLPGVGAFHHPTVCGPKRRGNNEGSISKRADGRWMGRYTVQVTDGPKRKAIYVKTREEVAEKLTKAMADRDGGLYFEAENLSVSAFLERWLNDSVRGSVRASTHASYRRQVQRYIVPAIGRMKLKKVTPAHVQGLYRSMLDRGLSTRTVQYTHAVLRRALKQATRWGMIPRNPCDDADAPKVQREEIRPLNGEQTRQLLRAAEGKRLEALYVLAVYTGMRPGELLAFKWQDVDIDASRLQVNRALSDGEFTPPKSRRSIDLTAGSAAALRAHRKRQLEELMRKAGLWQDHSLVFPSCVGTPLSHRNVVRAFKELLKRAGLPETTRLYDLRHTCATLLLSRNVHPKYVQELLGHASIAQTLDTYSHVVPGMNGGTARHRGSSGLLTDCAVG
jgi:integrase